MAGQGRASPCAAALSGAALLHADPSAACAVLDCASLGSRGTSWTRDCSIVCVGRRGGDKTAKREQARSRRARLTFRVRNTTTAGGHLVNY
eukprot:scaffold9742_cov105-Isochrysis_galbana.AAC.1